MAWMPLLTDRIRNLIKNSGQSVLIDNSDQVFESFTARDGRILRL
jgi:hypothetical protein